MWTASTVFFQTAVFLRDLAALACATSSLNCLGDFLSSGSEPLLRRSASEVESEVGFRAPRLLLPLLPLLLLLLPLPLPLLLLLLLHLLLLKLSLLLPPLLLLLLLLLLPQSEAAGPKSISSSWAGVGLSESQLNLRRGTCGSSSFSTSGRMGR